MPIILENHGLRDRDAPNMLFNLIIRSVRAGGATSLVMREINDQFRFDVDLTIGTDYSIKILGNEGYFFKFRIWDIAGHSGFDTIVKSYHQTCDAYIACLDLTAQDEFAGIRSRIALLPPGTPIFLFVNKIDVTSQWVYADEEIAAFAEAIGAKAYFRCSAKTGEGVKEAFHAVYNHLAQTHAHKIIVASTTLVPETEAAVATAEKMMGNFIASSNLAESFLRPLVKPNFARPSRVAPLSEHLRKAQPPQALLEELRLAPIPERISQLRLLRARSFLLYCLIRIECLNTSVAAETTRHTLKPNALTLANIIIQLEQNHSVAFEPRISDKIDADIKRLAPEIDASTSEKTPCTDDAIAAIKVLADLLCAPQTVISELEPETAAAAAAPAPSAPSKTDTAPAPSAPLAPPGALTANSLTPQARDDAPPPYSLEPARGETRTLGGPPPP